MISSASIINHLKARPAISVRMIEQIAKVPGTTIAQAMNNPDRAIPDKHLPAIAKVLSQYGFVIPGTTAKRNKTGK